MTDSLRLFLNLCDKLFKKKITYISHLKLLVEWGLICNSSHLALDLLATHVTDWNYSILILLCLHVLHIKLIIEIVV